MRAHRSWPFAALAALVAPACVLTTSLDGFSGGAGTDATPPQEGGEAAVDADLSETASADGADAAAPFHCADWEKGAVFCDDFERATLDVGFTETVAVSGGLVAPVPGRFGGGLEGRIPQRGTSVSPRPAGALSKYLDAIPVGSSFTIAADVRVEPPAGAGVIDYGGFYFVAPFYVLTLRSDDDGNVYFREYAEPYNARPMISKNTTLAHGPTPGVFTHVVFTVTLGAGASTAKLTFDDEIMVETVPISAHLYASTPRLPVGIFGAEGAGKAVKMVFDDVLVTMP